MAGFVEIRDLVKQHAGQGILARRGGGVLAVDRVSLAIPARTTFGLVGESGCGKTTLARALLYLDPPTSGQVVLDGTRLDTLSRRALRRFRRRMQIVFQDPNGALDPKMSIQASLGEGLQNLGKSAGERRRRTRELLEMVGISPERAAWHPHEFSGGQKQRIVVARALSMDPDFLVLDEPVSNLDVSIQAQIINLLLDLKEKLALTYLFISHDLNLVAYLSDAIAVMYRGRIVEMAPTEMILREPLHPYTRNLFSVVPGTSGEGIQRKVITVRNAEAEEAVRSSPVLSAGCRYAERCSVGDFACAEREPELTDAGGGHLVACLKR